MTEHEQKAEADHEKQKARLEVNTSVKKVVPGPDVLREGHGHQLNRNEHQQKAARVLSRVGQPCACIVIGPIQVRSSIQEFSASFDDRTPSGELTLLTLDAAQTHCVADLWKK